MSKHKKFIPLLSGMFTFPSENIFECLKKKNKKKITIAATDNGKKATHTFMETRGNILFFQEQKTK